MTDIGLPRASSTDCKQVEQKTLIFMTKHIYLLMALLAMAFSSCGGSASEEQPMGPEDTVIAFNRAITAGDFTQAAALCDTAAMKDYLDSYTEAWEVISREDSSALAIASSILSGAVIEITDVKKAEDRRIVSYTLEADGHSKQRSATVRKEGKTWRVERITDAI